MAAWGYEFYLQTVLSSCLVQRHGLMPITVMIRFSTRGAYLLLVPQERGLIRSGRLLRTGRLFLFEKRRNEKQSFDAYFTKDQKDLKTGLSLAESFL